MGSEMCIRDRRSPVQGILAAVILATVSLLTNLQSPEDLSVVDVQPLLGDSSGPELSHQRSRVGSPAHLRGLELGTALVAGRSLGDCLRRTGLGGPLPPWMGHRLLRLVGRVVQSVLVRGGTGDGLLLGVAGWVMRRADGWGFAASLLVPGGLIAEPVTVSYTHLTLPTTPYV